MKTPEFILPPREQHPVDLARTTRRTVRALIALLVVVCGVSLTEMRESSQASLALADGHDVLHELVTLREAGAELRVLEADVVPRADSEVQQEWRLLATAFDSARARLVLAGQQDLRATQNVALIDSLVPVHLAAANKAIALRHVDSAQRKAARAAAEESLAGITLAARNLEMVERAALDRRAHRARANAVESVIAMAGALVLVLIVGLSAERVVTRELTRRAAAEDERDRMSEEVAMQAEELQAQTDELLATAEDLLIAEAAAAKANRAKSEFLATMSHELRTPLNSIIGFTNVLRRNRRGVLDLTDLRYLERIAANGSHLLGLINQVLDLSKIEARRVEVAPQPTDVGALATDVVRQLEGNVQPGVELRVDATAALAPVVTDPDKLRQVMINLVGNALKFTRSGSVVLRVHADAIGRPTRIEVADTGIGMTPDRLVRIFEPFEQGGSEIAREYGGTGLGLSISRALCEALGHELTARSTPGAGSTFTVELEPVPAELRRAS